MSPYVRSSYGVGSAVLSRFHNRCAIALQVHKAYVTVYIDVLLQLIERIE